MHCLASLCLSQIRQYYAYLEEGDSDLSLKLWMYLIADNTITHQELRRRT